MLRAIAVIAAAGGCVLAGCSGAARLKRRYAALSEICTGLRRISLGLAYTNQTVAELIVNVGGEGTQGLFTRVARDVASGTTPMAAWERAEREGRAALCGLSPNDGKALTVFFSLLGGSDRCSQRKHADAALGMLSVQCAAARDAYEKNGRIYRTMGVLLGAGMAILML